MVLALLRRAMLRRHAIPWAAVPATLLGGAAGCLGVTHCASDAASAPREQSLALWQRACNFVYFSPFKSIIGFLTPAYAAVFAYESSNPKTANMLLSQRLIHTRVYGQAIAVITTVSVMSFVSMMDKQGGAYRVDGAEVVRGDAPAKLRHWYSGSEAEQLAREKEIAEKYARNHGPSADLLLPLVYAPLLPLVWLGLRHRMPAHQLTKIIMGITGVAFVHGVYVMVGDSSMTMGS